MDDQASLEMILETLISYIYVFAPQGRLGGLQSLHIDQARDMIQQGYAVSDTFKTSSKYGYQPILIPADIHWLFKVYLKVRSNICTRRKSECTYLWINWKGEQAKDLGRLLTRFFLCHARINMTTTTIRTMIEMAAHDACLGGLITPADKEAIHNVNGHTSEVVRDFYLLADTDKNVRLGTTGLNSALGSPPPYEEPEPYYARTSWEGIYIYYIYIIYTYRDMHTYIHYIYI